MLAVEQKAAMDQYLTDKRYHVTMESNNSRLAIYSGLIDTKTGNVDTQSSVHWRYWGKQASRTLYYACSKVSETVYTW